MVWSSTSSQSVSRLLHAVLIGARRPYIMFFDYEGVSPPVMCLRSSGSPRCAMHASGACYVYGLCAEAVLGPLDDSSIPIHVLVTRWIAFAWALCFTCATMGACASISNSSELIATALLFNVQHGLLSRALAFHRPSRLILTSSGIRVEVLSRPDPSCVVPSAS